MSTFRWQASTLATQPDPVGQRWNIQVQRKPVLPTLIQETLFG